MLACLIGAARFELATFRPPAERATKLRHAPGWISLGVSCGARQRIAPRAGDRSRTGDGSLEGSSVTNYTTPATEPDYRFGSRNSLRRSHLRLSALDERPGGARAVGRATTSSRATR